MLSTDKNTNTHDCSSEWSNFEKEKFSDWKITIACILNKYILVYSKSICYASVCASLQVACVSHVCAHDMHKFPFQSGCLSVILRTRSHAHARTTVCGLLKINFTRNKPTDRSCMHSVIVMTYIVTQQKCKLVAFFQHLMSYFSILCYFVTLFCCWNIATFAPLLDD